MSFAVPKLTDGQLFIGSTGQFPVAASLVSGDGSVIITPGAGSIDLSASGAIGPGTPDTVAKFTGAGSTLGDSRITDDGAAPIGIDADIEFVNGANRTISIADQTVANADGDQLNLLGAAGLGIGQGGGFSLVGGTGGATGAGGEGNFVGGDGGATSGNGGGFTITGGTSTDGDGGSITITPGQGGGAGVDGQIILAGDVNLPNLSPSEVVFLDANNLIVSTPLADGELLIGATGTDPAAGSLASANSTVTITPSAGTIDLSVIAPISDGTVQVVGAQQAAITDASVLLTDVVTQFNTLLAELRTHGLIAT